MSKAKNAKTASGSVSAATKDQSGTEQFIPLNRLKKSPRNARKTPHPVADIEALAASIASHGMLQAPVVEPEIKDDKPTGCYLVTIGEGRRQAQLLRVRRKEIAKTEPIRCIVETSRDAFEISLAENAIRSPMHPADQFEAFHRMSTEQGLSAEDIAGRFGVTPAVVRQRLKLANISPVLIEAYREGQLTLEMLSAFAITDDHARQQEVFDAMHPSDDRDDILAALNATHIPASDPRALFVGKEAYVEAGGGIISDLFDEDNKGFFTNSVLLFDLAAKKLAAEAESIKAEGWKWVDVMPRFDYDAVADCRRVYPQERELSDAEAEQLAALEEQYDAIEVESADAAADSQRLEQAIEALRGEEVFAPETVARAGAVVTIAGDGGLRIERGFIRPADDERRETKAGKGERPAPLSDKLVAELTAYRTSALRNALARKPDIAFCVVLHNLVEQVYYPAGEDQSCLSLRLQLARLQHYAEHIDESESEKEVADRHQMWAKRLPETADGLWRFLGSLCRAEQMVLLAHCASLAFDSVQQPGKPAKPIVDEIATTIGFDMAAHWSPTPANYLGRVSKQRILEAVREGVSNEAADNLASLKKGPLAEAAAERLAGKGWLPTVLRIAPQPEEATA